MGAMKILPLEKAQSRFRSAQRATSALAEASNPDDQYDHWVDFLSAWKAVYNHIEQAAKSSPKEMQWYGNVKAERRGDPLLSYLFAARNDEEHGTDKSAMTHHGLTPFIPDRDMTITSIGYDHERRTMTLIDENGDEVVAPLQLSEPGLLLRTVQARGNISVPLPFSHMGEAIEPTPIVVATAGLRYIEILCATAAAMHSP